MYNTLQRSAFILLLIAIGLAAGVHIHANANEHERVQSPVNTGQEHAKLLDGQIERWIQELAQEKNWQHWQQAEWERYPFGPGMHGWIVLLTMDGEEIGYLVVTGEAGAYELTEYGSGPYPLFSLRTLEQSLARTELTAEVDLDVVDPIRLYAGPFQAVWKLNEGEHAVYYDAKTGERFPLDDRSVADGIQSWEAVKPRMPQHGSTSSATHVRLDAFDPFMKLNWVDNEPIAIATDEKLEALLAPDGAGTLTYTARIFNEQVTVPFAVTGYHRWKPNDTTLYVRVEHFGERYIPFFLFQQFGEFYGERDDSRS